MSLFFNPMTTMPSNDPFSMIDTMLEDPRLRSWNKRDDRLEHKYRPKCDVFESNDCLSVWANLPGLKKEEVKVDIDEVNRTLTICGDLQRIEKQDQECWCCERPHGPFCRVVRLPNNADFSNVKASMEDGVLKVIIGKSEKKEKTKSIQVE